MVIGESSGEQRARAYRCHTRREMAEDDTRRTTRWASWSVGQDVSTALKS